MFWYYENGDGGVMKMAKLPSPMLASVTIILAYASERYDV